MAISKNDLNNCVDRCFTNAELKCLNMLENYIDQELVKGRRNFELSNFLGKLHVDADYRRTVGNSILVCHQRRTRMLDNVLNKYKALGWLVSYSEDLAFDREISIAGYRFN